MWLAFVGQTPSSAADPLVGFVRLLRMPWERLCSPALGTRPIAAQPRELYATGVGNRREPREMRSLDGSIH